MSEFGVPPVSVVGQLRAVVTMVLRSTVNSLRRRQGRGALLIFPVLLTFLVVELARFGARGASGMLRVLERVPPARAVHYGAFWILVMLFAITALKYSRVVPGRGSRKMFDTVLFRALPVSAGTRLWFELLVASTHAAGFLLLVLAPAVWGLARHHHGETSSLAITAAVTFGVNAVASAAAVALHEGWTRRLSGRGLDLARVVAGVTGVVLVGAFSTAGPLGAGIARTLRTGTTVPPWSRWLPTRPLVRWILGEASIDAIGRTLLLFGLPVVIASAVFLWRAREPADLSLDAPSAPRGARRWEPGLAPWSVELRALLRQAPYLVFAAPAFLAFFLLLAKGARTATGSDLPSVVLMGLTGWAVVVMGTALSGALSRRWRRVLWIPTALGRDHADSIRGAAAAHSALTVALALSVLAVLFRHDHPGFGWFARMVLGLAGVISVGQWLQASAVFLLIDPAPDRLTGLSVGALFGVLATALPTAALVVMLSATILPVWLTLVALLAFFAWSVERAAVERLRWIRDPEGDPDAAKRTWPALRTWGVGMMGQVLVMQLCETLGTRVSLAAAIVLGYLAFAGVVVPLAWRAWQGFAVEPRWGRARAVTTGALGGLVYFALATLYARWASGRWGASTGPFSQSLASAAPLWKAPLVMTAAVLGPVSEELFFRGWLQHALKRDVPERLARWTFVMAAGVFAVMHVGEAWLPALTAGLLAGILMEKSGRIEASLTLHVTANSLAMTAALGAFGRP